MNSHIKSLIAWFAERHRRSRELEELSSMNDHQLKDIGLTKMDRHLVLKTGKFPVRRFHSDGESGPIDREADRPGPSGLDD